MAIFEVVLRTAVDIEAPTGKAAKALVESQGLKQLLVLAATRNEWQPYTKPTATNKISG